MAIVVGVTTAAPAVLLVTALSRLVDDVGRLCAAVGLGLLVVADVDAAGVAWWSAPLVLLGEDAAAVGVPRRRPAVVLVATSAGPQGRVWRWAVDAGAEHVALLPEAEPWLLERLSAVEASAGPPGRTVGVMAGCGGGGASTLATALACAASVRGSVLLVDADPLGGGLDLLIRADGAPGLVWSDLGGVRGPVQPSVLRDALPMVAGLSLLGWGPAGSERSGPGGEAVDAVLGSARRSHDVVVVDLPRQGGAEWVAALRRLDLLLVVVPLELRAAVAASRLLPQVRAQVPDVRLVARGPGVAGLDAATVADVLGVPMAGSWRAQPRLAAVLDRDGLRPGRAMRGGLVASAGKLLDAVLAEPARAGVE